MSEARPTEEKRSILAARELSLPVEKLLRALLGLAPARRVSILDSGGARAPDARFLIAGFDPFEIIEARGDKLFITRGQEQLDEKGDVFDALDQRLASFHVSSSLQQDVPVVGACIATLSYDLARPFARLRPLPAHEESEPEAVLAFYDTLVVHDYLKNVTRIVSVSGPERMDEFQDALVAATRELEEDEAAEFSSLTLRAARSNFTREEYLRAILRIKEHIAAGDIYQANLTQQLSVELDGRAHPENIFLRLRRDNPASFAAFIRRRDDAVISCSPERFLRVQPHGREIEAWPIKGTRPRGHDALEDSALRAELAASEKDRAENVMIVDLLRNDLGRVCRYGTVHVPELFTVQEHPTLFHLVSKVRGLLRDGVTAGEILRATFPCGSITGAPKLRAMEILDDVEPDARALSMGALGYFSFDGAIDLSVAIRTMTIRASRARFNVGGGIVADSRPEEEYEESLTKARALLRALNATLFPR